MTVPSWVPTPAGMQLRGWTAATYRTASQDVTMRSTVIALAVLDQAPSWPRLRERLDRLTRLVPVLRMRPVRLAAGAPRLILDPDFDLDIHVRRYRLPEDVGWPGVLDDARRMSLTDFDASRPLWEAVLVEGLPNGQAAFLLKLHHSIADGQATVLMALSLFEFSPESSTTEPEPPVVPAAPDIRGVDVQIADLVDNARRGIGLAVAAARFAGDTVRGTMRDPVGTLSAAAANLSSIGRVAEVPVGAKSPVLTGRGSTYRFATLDLPFADLRSAAKSRGMSINDAFLAAIGAGLDAYHRRHGAAVSDLRINVPISLRGDPGDRSGGQSNAVAIARFLMPIGGLTVDERMQAAHDLVASWRAEPAMKLADPLADISWFVPVPMLAAAARASDITASNVPGPPVPLYLAGARMIAAYPLVATIGAAVSVTMVTYDGTAFLGVSADDRAVRDLDTLVTDLAGGFADITGRWPSLGEPSAAS